MWLQVTREPPYPVVFLGVLFFVYCFLAEKITAIAIAFSKVGHLHCTSSQRTCGSFKIDKFGQI